MVRSDCMLMTRNVLLTVLTLTAPVLLWWPVSIEPNLDLPGWLPLVFLALWMVLATIVSEGHWLRILGACAVGNLAGFVVLAIWWPTEPLARSYLPISILIGTTATVIVCLIAGFAARKICVLNSTIRHAIWVGLMCCFIIGPVTVAATPRLVADRVRNNDQIAMARFTSLKKAVEQTIAEPGGTELICDGTNLKQHYSGPPFSDENWQRIVGNYVKQSGYIFMVYCHETAGYTIAAQPDRIKGDGTLQLCTDESRRIGCGMEWNRSRNACLPCPQ